MERLPPAEAAVLLDIAEAAVVDGLRGLRAWRGRRGSHGGRRAPAVALDGLPPSLLEPRGVFVTLTVGGELNGCIGTIEGDQPLASATAYYAQAAAFEDPRLPALQWADLDTLEIEVSVLSPLAPMPAGSREEVLGWLRPGVHGLVLAAGGRRAVFLPAVWDKLPEAGEFVSHLLSKAGLPARGWAPGMKAWRFTADKHARPARSVVASPLRRG